MKTFKRFTFIAAAALLGVPRALLGADAGSVTFATGSVTAERAPAATLSKGDAVRVDDQVITGTASRAQLLMLDGARIAVRPDSRISIEEYVYAAADPGSTATVTTSDDDSSVIGLVKGGFRTITGAIGKENPSNYEVRTAVGVLGIRGTDFAVLLCSGDCGGEPDGLYVRVSEDSIFFSNEIATVDVNAGEFLFVPLESRKPERLDIAPPVFAADDGSFSFQIEVQPDLSPESPPAGFDTKLGTRREPDSSAPEPQGDGEDDSSRPEIPKQSIEGIDRDGTPVDLTPGSPPDPQGRTISMSTGPLGAATEFWSASLFNDPTQLRLDGNNNVTGFSGLYPGRAATDVSDFDIGTSNNVDTGFDQMTVLRWGRWAGGTADITLSDGTPVPENLGNQSLHWISSPDGAVPVMPVSGSASYTLIGSTSPTDDQGNVGVLGAATFDADFTNMLVDSTLVIDIAGSTWTAAGQGSIGAAAQLPAHLFQGFYNAVAVDGITGGTGTFSGFFSAPGQTSDPSFPGGAGLTYSLQDQGGTTTVSGAAAFGNP